tara:strand:+ start:98 stop:2008 length:1911 start_codon:yes stop_codon:yes gene_type:complete
MTYYKYVKREAGSQINWAEVGKNMSDMLIEERDIREKKKADIDAATREFQTILDNSPESEHKGMAEFTLDFTSNVQKAYLMQDKLLKSGGLSLRDYTIQRQNIVDGVNNTYNLIKSYNADFLVAKEKLDAGELSAFSTQMMERVESFGQITNSKIFINPTDFKLSLAKTVIDENGVEHMSDDPNEHATVDSLKVRTTQLIDVFDVKGALAEDVSYLADVYQEALNRKAIKTLDDLRKNPKYAESVKNTIDSVLTNQMNAASVLADNSVDKVTYDAKGNEISREEINWEFTEDPEQAASDVRFILVETNPDGSQTPKLTEEQMEIAGGWVNTQIEMMIRKKEEARQEFAPKSRTTSPTQTETVDKAQLNNKSRVLNASHIVGGSEEQFDAAIGAIVNRYKDDTRGTIVDIDRILDKKGQLDGIVISYYNSATGKKDSATIEYNTADGPRSAEAIIKDFFQNVYSTGDNFEKALEDFNAKSTEALITVDDFDVSKQKWTRKDEYKEYDIDINMQTPRGATYEEEFMLLPDEKGNYKKAALLVNRTLKELKGAGVNGGIYKPTVEEAKEIFANDPNLSGTPKASWIGNGWINGKWGNNVVIWKVNGKVNYAVFDANGQQLWSDLYNSMDEGELDPDPSE